MPSCKPTGTDLARMYATLSSWGIDRETADKLRRCSTRLSRWAEKECGNEFGVFVCEDETDGRTYLYRDGERLYPVPNDEERALKRVALILKDFPALVYYHQGDPRGVALYIGERERLLGERLGSVYSSRMLPVW